MIVHLTRELLRIGGLYFTYSGDPEVPYKHAKLLRLDENGLFVKLYMNDHTSRPDHPPKGKYRVVLISVEMFLAWGPPKFPIFLHDEGVSSSEQAACEIALTKGIGPVEE